MQRTANMPPPRSSTKPPGVGTWRDTPDRAAASAACRSAAAGVSGGTRPSGGSTTSDVRLVSTTVVPRSNQNWL